MIKFNYKSERNGKGMFKKLKTLRWGYIFIGILLILLGVCFAVFASSLKILAAAIGAVLTLFGLVYGFIAISDRGRSLRFALKISLAVICICGGIITVVFNARSVSVLIAIFCLLLIVDGSFKLSTAAEARRYAVRGAWILMTASSLVIVFAFITAVALSPSSAASSCTVGAVIIVDGVLNLLSCSWSSKCERAREKYIYLKIKKELENSDK